MNTFSKGDSARAGGAIDRDERTIADLLNKGAGFGAKFAVLTSFSEMVVYDALSKKCYSELTAQWNTT
jgi:hypothetical protein